MLNRFPKLNPVDNRFLDTHIHGYIEIGPNVTNTTATNVDFDSHHTFMREAAADVEYNELRTEFECPWSMNRERMAKEIESLRLTRPKKK